MTGCNRSVALARMPWGWSASISLAFAGGRQLAHARGWGGVDLSRPIARWPRTWGHHGAVKQVRCTRADALVLVSIDLSGICGWSPTCAHTRLGRGGLAWPNISMATHLGTPRRGATGPLHSRRCSGDGQHRSVWHLRVVANSRTHAVGAVWTCVAQSFDGHALGDTKARCNMSVALARISLCWASSISLAFAGGRQPAHARGWGGVDLSRPIVRWPRTWGHHGAVQQVRCTRADVLGMVTIDLSGIGGWSPTRAHT